MQSDIKKQKRKKEKKKTNNDNRYLKEHNKMNHFKLFCIGIGVVVVLINNCLVWYRFFPIIALASETLC